MYLLYIKGCVEVGGRLVAIVPVVKYTFYIHIYNFATAHPLFISHVLSMP